jgi:Protein of unknown function (DUF669)
MTTILDQAFDHEKEQGLPERELLPPGNYLAQVVDSQVGPMRNGRGTQVANMLTIMEPVQFENQTVFLNCIISHESEKAVQFGKARLKNLCAGVGLTEPLTDLSALCFKPCVIKVRISRDKNGVYPDRNEISSVSGAGAWDELKKLIRAATSTPPAFDAKAEGMDDSIPF